MAFQQHGFFTGGGQVEYDRGWQRCMDRLQEELSAEEFETWIRPLQAKRTPNGLILLAPNPWVERQAKMYLNKISENLDEQVSVKLEVGDVIVPRTDPLRANGEGGVQRDFQRNAFSGHYTFDTFVEGKSNQWAKAAAEQVAANPGTANSPLLLHGGHGLGKTHLIHAISNQIRANSPQSNVLYQHSQRFIEDMVIAVKKGTMQDFARFYCSQDVLLVDDIQMFAQTVKSQEEIFHIFNKLTDAGRQIVLTSDRYPREIEGLEKRLVSRFLWGNSAFLEPPDMETRAAILMRKAEGMKTPLAKEVAFFIAERVRSNVRELEGALKKVVSTARFEGCQITVEHARHTLRDLLGSQDRRLRISTIQDTVADYYHIKKSDMLSQRRTKNVLLPRQMAMYLCRELTNRSLPEIGEKFGGRDHTTVLHAWRKINEPKEADASVEDDCRNLIRLLTD